MSILDAKTLFGRNVSIAGSASAVVAMTNALKLDAVTKYLGTAFLGDSAMNDLGRANGMMLNVRVTSTQLAASSTAAALDIRLHKKANGSSIESGSVVYTVQVPNVNKAASIASHTKLGAYLLRLKIPRDLWGDITKTYVGVSTKVLTNKILTGKITAWLGREDDDVLP